MYRGKQPSSFLIPARNSRHRTACLALYRALLEAAPKVSLPEDLVPLGGPNPIARHITRAFRRNRDDVSPRIVYPALRAGYDALEALNLAAQDPESAEHASVIALLRSGKPRPPPPSLPSSSPPSSVARVDKETTPSSQPSPPTPLQSPEKKRKKKKNPRAPPSVNPKTGEKLPKPGAPRAGTVPLFVNVTPTPTRSTPYPKPVYETPHRPLPLSSLGGSGRRQVPRLDMAGDFAFARLTKPQPAVLSRILTQKVKKRAERGRAILEMMDEGALEAEEEDAWEMVLANLLSDERWAVLYRTCDAVDNSSSNSGDPPSKQEEKDVKGKQDFILQLQRAEYEIRLDESRRNTYRSDLRTYGSRHLMELLNREREDQVARADALRHLIAQESALAKQEKEERKARSHEVRHSRWLAEQAEKLRLAEVVTEMGTVMETEKEKRDVVREEVEEWYRRSESDWDDDEGCDGEEDERDGPGFW
ncbi:hypothetical protein F4810DRAFT_690756 [Camillea tinctor]|nr:hypothetical protein F4810DRAFT_690756 [Camillea tinctor]